MRASWIQAKYGSNAWNFSGAMRIIQRKVIPSTVRRAVRPLANNPGRRSFLLPQLYCAWDRNWIKQTAASYPQPEAADPGLARWRGAAISRYNYNEETYYLGTLSPNC